MPKPMELQLHRRAEMAIKYFSPHVQKKIWKAIEALQQEGLKTSLKRSEIHKLTGLKNVFMMRVNRNLRMIFSLEGETLTILDVFTREQLRRLQHLFATGG